MDNVFIPTHSFSNKPGLGLRGNLISVRRKNETGVLGKDTWVLIECETVILIRLIGAEVRRQHGHITYNMPY